MKEPSLLSTAYKYGVPIFVGAVQDGSIFLNIVKLKRLLGRVVQARDRRERRRLRDGRDAAPLLRDAQEADGRVDPRRRRARRTTRCRASRCSTRSSACPTHGFDIDVQLCVDPVDNGALSSCPAGEGHTWGKVSAESVASGSVYVHADVTAVFPWLTYALLSDPKMKRKHRRLYDERAGAVATLQREVDKRRKELAQDDRLPAAQARRGESGERQAAEWMLRRSTKRRRGHPRAQRPPARARARAAASRCATRERARPAGGRALHAEGHVGHAGHADDGRLVAAPRARADRGRRRCSRRCSETGAVLLGKSNCCDLALAWESYNHLVGADAQPARRGALGGRQLGRRGVRRGERHGGVRLGDRLRRLASASRRRSAASTGLRLSSEPWPVNEQHFPRLAPHFWPWVGMGPIARTPATAACVLDALRRAAAPVPDVRDAHATRWRSTRPTRRAAAGGRRSSATRRGARCAAGVRFEVDRTLPAARRTRTTSTTRYVSSHFDEFSATGELEFREGLAAVLLGLATLGPPRQARAPDERRHPRAHGARPRPPSSATGARWERELDGRARARATRLGRAAGSSSRRRRPACPPRHGRAVLDWSVLAFTKLGNLTDATCHRRPLRPLRRDGVCRGACRSSVRPGSEQAVLDLAERARAPRDRPAAHS